VLLCFGIHVPSIHISLKKRDGAIAFFDRAGRALREDLIILIGFSTLIIIIINEMTKYFCYSYFAGLLFFVRMSRNEAKETICRGSKPPP